MVRPIDRRWSSVVKAAGHRRRSKRPERTSRRRLAPRPEPVGRRFCRRLRVALSAARALVSAPSPLRGPAAGRSLRGPPGPVCGDRSPISLAERKAPGVPNLGRGLAARRRFMPAKGLRLPCPSHSSRAGTGITRTVYPAPAARPRGNAKKSCFSASFAVSSQDVRRSDAVPGTLHQKSSHSDGDVRKAASAPGVRGAAVSLERRRQQGGRCFSPAGRGPGGAVWPFRLCRSGQAEWRRSGGVQRGTNECRTVTWRTCRLEGS